MTPRPPQPSPEPPAESPRPAPDLPVGGGSGATSPAAPRTPAGPATHAAGPARASRVVWPEAGQADDVATLEAARVPAVEQTGMTAGTAGSTARTESMGPREFTAPAAPAAPTAPAAPAAPTAPAAPAGSRPAQPGSGPPDEPCASGAEQLNAQGDAPRVRGSADPVRALMHQYRGLCEQAVDPLEIAAGLEARGITDRTAARFRHRDVFSLAEELYVRVPRAEPPERAGSPVSTGSSKTAGTGTTARAVRRASGRTGEPAEPASATARPLRPLRFIRPIRAAVRLVVPLLPGVLCSAAFGASAFLPELPLPARQAVAVVGTLATLAALWFAVRPSLRGGAVPSGEAETARAPGVAGRAQTAAPGLPVLPALSVCGLLGYALYGDWLLAALLAGGPDPGGDEPVLTCRCVPLGLAFAVAPAVWCARIFAVRARRRLEGSRSLAEFAAGVRPLLAGVVVLFTVLLLAAQSAARLAVDGRLPAAGTQTATGALGVLLFVALLLSAHGFPGGAAAGLATGCVLEAFALGSVLAARLPGLDVVGQPAGRTVAEFGPSAVPAVLCAAVALALLAYATRVLTGASAHDRRATP